ncbi:MAG: MFS transporter [Candidatus Binataceae bacterium]
MKNRASGELVSPVERRAQPRGFGEKSAAGFNLFSLAWLHFLNDGASNYLPGVLPAVLEMLHIPVALVGAVMAGLLIGQIIQPVCGWVADRTGGRMFIIVGLIGSTAGGALLVLSPNDWVLGLALIIIGIGNSIFHPQAMTAVRHLPGRSHGLFMSVYQIGGELGRGIWPMLASLLVVAISLRAVALLAIPALLTLPFIAPQLPRLPRRRPAQTHYRWRHYVKGFSPVVAFAALRSTLTYSLATFLPLWWVHRGGSLVTGAALVTTLFTVGIIGNLGGGYFSDRIGRRVVASIACVMSSALLAIFLLVNGFVIWIVLALLGISVFATLPIQVLAGQDVMPEDRAMGSGMSLGFSSGIGAVAIALLGILAARWSIPAVLWINVGLNLIAAALAPLLTEGPRREGIQDLRSEGI